MKIAKQAGVVLSSADFRGKISLGSRLRAIRRRFGVVAWNVPALRKVYRPVGSDDFRIRTRPRRELPACLDPVFYLDQEGLDLTRTLRQHKFRFQLGTPAFDT